MRVESRRMKQGSAESFASLPLSDWNIANHSAIWLLTTPDRGCNPMTLAKALYSHVSQIHTIRPTKLKLAILTMVHTRELDPRHSVQGHSRSIRTQCTSEGVRSLEAFSRRTFQVEFHPVVRVH